MDVSRRLFIRNGVATVTACHGPAERPLYGWVSMPAGGLARCGAVLCPPMGEEGRSAGRREGLGVADPGGRVLVGGKDDGRGDHWSCQWSAACFIDAQEETTRRPRRAFAVEGRAGRRQPQTSRFSLIWRNERA